MIRIALAALIWLTFSTWMPADEAQLARSQMTLRQPSALLQERLPPIEGVKPVLRVAIVSLPGVYRLTELGTYGFEHELLLDFAKAFGYDLQLLEVNDKAAALAAVEVGAADLAAADIGMLSEPPSWLGYSLPLFSSPYVVAFRQSRRGAPSSMLELLNGGLEVAKADDLMAQMHRILATFPELPWTFQAGLTLPSVFQRLQEKHGRYTLTNRHQLHVYRLRYPRLGEAFELSDSRSTAWAWRPTKSNKQVRLDINRFLSQQIFSGDIRRRYAYHFRPLEEFTYPSVSAFVKRAKTRLPAYQLWFEQAARRYNFDWRFLAATAYQESIWDPDAVSPTGVRGIMMLTSATARELGVDRLIPKQSIFGGAKYLRSIKRRLNKRKIPEPDLTYLALASYNVGIGHVLQAQRLAKAAGKNPKRWENVREQLPRIGKRPFCTTLRLGCARGQEPVDYVDRIRAYYDLLVWHRPAAADDLVLPPGERMIMARSEATPSELPLFSSQLETDESILLSVGLSSGI